jgi:hypothetical protein
MKKKLFGSLMVLGLVAGYNIHAEVISAPDEVNATKGDFTNKVVVSWSNVSYATGYEVWRGMNSTNAEKIAEVSATNYYDDELAQPNVTYYYLVKATNEVGASEFSEADYGYLGVVGPVIYVNNKVGDLTLKSSEPITLSVQMENLVDYLGVGVDWWFGVYAPGMNKWFYMNSNFQLVEFSGNLAECRPAYQGGLINTPLLTLLNGYSVPAGVYILVFGVDYPMDGVLGLNGQIMCNLSVITVEP